MKPWKRNRLALALVIFLAVVIINIPAFTTTQALSLIALVIVLFFGYVVLWNNYKKK